MDQPEDAPEPIDLTALAAQLEGDGDVVVERAWLARVHAELSTLHEIRANIGRTFGLPKGQTL